MTIAADKIETGEPGRPSAAQFGWPEDRVREFGAAWTNGCVGHVLVSESDRVRVWHLRLEPGERIGFHRHVLDYFWTALSAGKSRSNLDDGRTVEAVYEAGSTVHHHYPRGEYKIHDLTNVGNTPLIFTTVEFLDSENPPLPLPAEVRQHAGN